MLPLLCAGWGAERLPQRAEDRLAAVDIRKALNARSRKVRTVMRRYPRISPESLRVSDRLSSLCFVLHRVGFFVPHQLLGER